MYSQGQQQKDESTNCQLEILNYFRFPKHDNDHRLSKIALGAKLSLY